MIDCTPIPVEGGARCTRCGFFVPGRSTFRANCGAGPIRVETSPPPPRKGPGTELRKIFHALKLKPSANCPCAERERQMNAWGPLGCRQQMPTILGWMQESYAHVTRADLLRLAAPLFTSGLAFRLNPLHPFRSLINLAIRRAEQDAPSPPPAPAR